MVDVEAAVGGEFEVPAAFVGLVVVAGAEGDEVVEVGWSFVFPGLEVVGLAPGDGSFAVGPGAGGVDGFEGGPLGGAGGASFAAEVDGDVVIVEEDGSEDGVAGEAVEGGVGEAGSLGGFAGGVGVGAVCCGFCVDDDDDGGSSLGAAVAGDEFEEGLGSEVVVDSDGFGAVCLVGQRSGFGIDGLGEGFLPFGVEFDVDVAHAVWGAPGSEV